MGVSIRMLSPITPRSDSTASPPMKSRKVAAESKDAYTDDDDRKKSEISEIKFYQCLMVVVISFAFQLCAGFSSNSSSLLWQLVSAVVLYICFHPENLPDGKKIEKVDTVTPLNKCEEANVTVEMTSTVGAELMKAGGGSTLSYHVIINFRTPQKCQHRRRQS